MFADTITLDYKGTDDLVLTKRKESNYSSEFFGTVGQEDIVLSIKHTIPANRLGGEHSHMVRMDVTSYNGDNIIVGRRSTWRVFASYLGQQNATALTEASASMDELLNPTNIAKLFAGES